LKRPELKEAKESTQIRFKSLHERKLEYDKVRARIFAESVEFKKQKNYNKIKNLRNKAK